MTTTPAPAPARCYCPELEGVACSACRAAAFTIHPSRSGAVAVVMHYGGVRGGAAWRVWVEAIEAVERGATHRDKAHQRTFFEPDPAFDDAAGWQPEARERVKAATRAAANAYANDLWARL